MRQDPVTTDPTAEHADSSAKPNSASVTPRGRAGHRILPALWVLFGVLWLLLAIAPFDRFDWLLENLLVFALVIFLIGTRRTLPLSTVSHVLILAFLVLHTIGAHYTYSETPIGIWYQEVFATERNHYDRTIHFAFGLMMFCPIREIVDMTAQPKPGWSTIFAVTSVVFFSAVYEIIEWVTAELVSPEAAMAYLGTQGDAFDAQKDAVLAFVGSILAALGMGLWRRWDRARRTSRFGA